MTGGARFIWSLIVDRLLEEGHEVTAADDLSEVHLENADHMKTDKGSPPEEAVRVTARWTLANG